MQKRCIYAYCLHYLIIPVLSIPALRRCNLLTVASCGLLAVMLRVLSKRYTVARAQVVLIGVGICKYTTILVLFDSIHIMFVIHRLLSHPNQFLIC